jgi:transcriptional regulator with PAS, ATPase and Fis domain
VTENAWVKEFPGPVVVADEKGTIVEMNERAIAWFADKGGIELIGKSLHDVHQEASQEKIRQMTQRRERNVYTIEKDGAKVLVYQSPWYVDSVFAGLVEIGLDLPEEIPHHIRPAQPQT